jgi:hypothetical protein
LWFASSEAAILRLLALLSNGRKKSFLRRWRGEKIKGPIHRKKRPITPQSVAEIFFSADF